jgi:AraC-like DNA-binding protein
MGPRTRLDRGRGDERLFVKLDEDPIAGPESGTPMHALTRLRVPAPLAGVVSHILEYRESIAPGSEVVEQVLPDGIVRIVLHLGSAPSATIVGASIAPATVRLRGEMHGLSLALWPGAAAALLGVPAAEFAGRAVPLEAAWGVDAHTLIDRLNEARGPEARSVRSATLQVMLRRRWERQHGMQAPPIVTAALRLLRGGGPPTLPEMSATLGLGERRLQQLFHQHVGLSPRAWRRLARLQRIVRAMRHAARLPEGLGPDLGPGRPPDRDTHRETHRETLRETIREPHDEPSRGPNWADLALETGFYDQAHFANEFRSLAGLTPGEFWRRAVSGSSKTDT